MPVLGSQSGAFSTPRVSRLLTADQNVGDLNRAERADVSAGRAFAPRKRESMESGSELVDDRIAELGDWRGETLSRLRTLIKEADPEVVEEVKWRGTPVWSHDGILCSGESYKSIVKLTFAKGASLNDPSRLFNPSLDGYARRALETP